MKGFGTPSGAGPGSAKEKVGLAAVGTPGPLIPVDPVEPVFLAVFLVVFLTVFLTVDVSFEAVVCVSLPEVFFGFLKVEVVVEVFFWTVEVGDGLLVVVVGVVDVVLVCDGVVAVTVGVVGVVEVVWQLAVTFWTGGVPGGSICAGGVPGAAVTVNVTVWPSSSVAVTVHWSADAVGMAATPITPRTVPTVQRATFSLWLIDTLVYFLPPRTWTAPTPQERQVMDANGW